MNKRIADSVLGHKGVKTVLYVGISAIMWELHDLLIVTRGVKNLYCVVGRTTFILYCFMYVTDMPCTDRQQLLIAVMNILFTGNLLFIRYPV